MIHISKKCGICSGANRALNLVYKVNNKESVKENKKKIYIYKEILHNPKVIKELNDLGVETIDALEKLTNEDIVIIRTHGESKDVIEYLEKHNIEYYDATCQNVKKIHKKVFEKYNAGYEIIIIGKSDHPEVIGTNGWCENNAIIIENEDDIEKISSKIKKKYVVCQTTFNKELFNKLSLEIKEIFDGFEIIIDNTLCSVVENICKNNIELAKKCDLMFVIGGHNSANTKEIFREISKYTKSLMFDSINEFYKFILKEDLSKYENIGITGGASTPIKEIYNYKYLLSFIMYYKERLKELKQGQKEVNDKLKVNNYNENIDNVIEDFIDLNQDGKYIRGTLIALGSFLAKNKKDTNYLNLAYAYEMFQTSVLIHDDIIDNAKIRRGKETIPRRICERYLNNSNNKDYHNDVLVMANSIGICAGDLGFYEANKLIIDSYYNNKNLNKILKLYNDIVIKTIKGEMLDVILPFMGKYNYKEILEKDILDIYHLKTSWYTIIGPFFLGYTLEGKEINEKLENILNKIGIAFQVKDDILGIFSDSKKIGKSNTSDIEEFKQTILYTYIINTEYKDEFLKIYGKKNIKDSDLIKIRELLKLSGSYDYANDYLDNLYSDVIDSLDKIELSNESKDILKGLLIYINIREK